MAIYQYRNICFQSYLFGLGTKPFKKEEYCYNINLIYTIAYYSILFPTVSQPITSALAANFAYLYTLPLCIFFSSLYHNVVIQSTSLQYCDSKACIYIKLNIIYIFNRLRITKGDKWLTIFYTRYRLFKYLIILFSLVNALSLFQYFINNTLRPYLDIFYITYINNILIYSNNLTKY